MKDIIRMNQLAGIITEGQTKKMMEVLDEEQNVFDKSDLTSVNPSDKEFEAIVNWLSSEYDFDEIEDMLSNSKISKKDDIITIQYSNGVEDIVKYHNGKIKFIR